jgi:hypothetical protein
MKKNHSLPYNGWDALFSTYYWTIQLDQSHPENKVSKIRGYSKHIGRDEARDKIYVLKSKIIMLIRKGYLSRSHRIEIWKRVGHTIDESKAQLIVTLFQHDYFINPDLMHRPGYGPLSIFMHDLYDCLRNGKETKHLATRAKDDYTKEEMVNVHRLRFGSLGAIDDYCNRLLHNGWPVPEIQRFRRKYLEVNPHLNPDEEVVKVVEVLNQALADRRSQQS